MECKNCKELMEEYERGEQDGMVTVIYECPSCFWKAKCWYDLEYPSNVSWVNDKGTSKD